MQVKITSVYDEGSQPGTSLIGAEGFSVLIEADGQSILFDTGKRGRYLLHNMMFLDIDPEKIDKLIISHGHSNHTGGIDELLKSRKNVLNIYSNSSAVGGKGPFGPKGIVISPELSSKAAIIDVKGWMEIAGKVFISPPMDMGKGMAETFVVITTKKGPVVIAACSHAGVDSIMEETKIKFGSFPYMYVGGTHIGKKEKEKAGSIAAAFSERGCAELYLNHCTGVNGMMHLGRDRGLKGVKDFFVSTVSTVDV
jgi:7,8-dihydropterin-6-yl-methyl-4-(beta-D-ribofuranosyl)aminobenzene 5'-phosphate synthase